MFFSGVWVETGRRINYDAGSGVAPKVGDWIFAVADKSVHGRIEAISGDGQSGHVVVTFLTGFLADNAAIELHTLQDNNGPNYEKSWTASANGPDVLEPGVFQAFGNAHQDSNDYLPSMGLGIAGFGYSQAYQSNTLTFGDGVNGFIVPAGARVRVPMVHMCTSTLALHPSGATVWSSSVSNTYELEVVNGGDCYLHGMSLGSTQWEDSLGSEFQASYCAANVSFGVYAATSRVSYDNCIVVSDIVNNARASSRGMFPIVDLVRGADIRDCLSLVLRDGANTNQIGGQTSNDINYERCIQISNNLVGAEAYFIRVSNLTINDLVVIGTRLILSACTGVSALLLKTQSDILGGNSQVADQIYITGGADGIKVTGWEILNDSAPNDSKVFISDSKNIEIRGFHFIDDKFDNEALGGTQGEEFASVGGFCKNITFARCWTDRGSPNEFVYQPSGTVQNLTVLNCSAEYNGEIEPDGINISYRGMHGGSGSLGSTTGLETDYPGTNGAHFGDVF